jgi:hypothetical protein
MADRSYDIKPTETQDSFGGVSFRYLPPYDPGGQVTAVSVRRLEEEGFEARIAFQDGTSEWVIVVPRDEWGLVLFRLWDKLRQFDCPHFDIAEPPPRT